MLLADRISIIPLRRRGSEASHRTCRDGLSWVIYRQQEPVVAVKMESNVNKKENAAQEAALSSGLVSAGLASAGFASAGFASAGFEPSLPI